MDENAAMQLQLGMLSLEARAAMTGSHPQVTLRAARERLENASTPAEQKALKQWVHQYETQLEAKRRHQLRQSVEADRERATQTTLRLRDISAELAEAAADAERGRISSADLRQAIQKADREAREVREMAENMHADAEQREQLKTADLADLQDKELDRFPVMRDRLPTLLGDLSGHRSDGLNEGRPTAPARSAGSGQMFAAPANINPADSMRGHADELFGSVRDALRSLESAESRERLLNGPATNVAAGLSGGLQEVMASRGQRS
ncbi:hypothetical protein FHG89_26010 [Micromonospora orduensis]|uniref:Uncharacterized protein n=1 Tax=Micromonospora orduensis TaxID=1420891 RepID=A0A5C4QDF8_9ACTN|nr:hypothetical protein [Micromonospora orduensis]TNH23968.1 hypothetical protein FHG89_26010 [Micromonospora orduensis]